MRENGHKDKGQKLINRTASYALPVDANIGAMSVHVVITGYRNAYGREEVRVRPMAGLGERWLLLRPIKRQGRAIPSPIKLHKQVR